MELLTIEFQSSTGRYFTLDMPGKVMAFKLPVVEIKAENLGEIVTQ
jgi:hypothetical protein